MWPWNGTSVPFGVQPWINSPEIVTPADLLDHLALGYRYDSVDGCIEIKPLKERIPKEFLPKERFPKELKERLPKEFKERLSKELQPKERLPKELMPKEFKERAPKEIKENFPKEAAPKEIFENDRKTFVENDLFIDPSSASRSDRRRSVLRARRVRIGRVAHPRRPPGSACRPSAPQVGAGPVM